MKISCPKCHLRGSIGNSLLKDRTRIICAQCATTFEVVSTDGVVEVIVPPIAPALPTHIAPALPATDTYMKSTPELEEVLAIERSPQSDFVAAREETPVLEIEPVESAQMPKAPLMPAIVTTSLPEREQRWAAAAATLAAAPLPKTFEQTAINPKPLPALASLPMETMEKASSFIQAPPSSLSQTDKYRLGVQLLQIRPWWLLLSGLAFVSFIIFCSWFIRSDDESSRSGMAYDVKSRNYASNQNTQAAQSRPSTSGAALPAATNGKAVPFGAPVEKSEPANPAEVTKAEVTKAAPAVVPPAAPSATSAPQASQGKAAVTTASVKSAGQDDGKFTVQVGAYNNAAQASERVASLEAAGFQARSVEVELPKRGTWYRVQAGRFRERAEAARYGEQLRARRAAESVLVTEVQGN